MCALLSDDAEVLYPGWADVLDHRAKNDHSIAAVGSRPEDQRLDSVGMRQHSTNTD